MNNEQQTQQADDPSGDGWRDVGPDELLRHGDLFWNVDHWQATQHAGQPAVDERTYRRRIEQQQQPSDSEPEIDHKQCVEALQQIAQLADTGSKAHKKRFCPNGEGDGIVNGWRVAEAMREVANNVVGGVSVQQPSDSEPETVDDLRRRLAEAEALVAEAERGGEQVNAELQQLREQVRTLRNDQIAAQQRFAQLIASQEQITKERDAMAAAYHDSCIRGEQVNAELQQLREQVATLTQKLKDANDTYQLCLQSHYKAGQRSTIDRLQTWLRPVLEVVSDHPDNTSILAVSVLEFLPQIASRLIEE